MPATHWPEDPYDPDTSTVKHADIAGLDVEHGKWFQCKFCKKSKDPAENKFVCRTAFGTEFLAARGHLESKSHEQNKAAAQKKPALMKAMLAATAGPSTNAPDVSAAPGDLPIVSPKATLPCNGLGWDVTHKDQPWQQHCKTYMFFVEGARN